MSKIHICLSALAKCYATIWSYGEICVKCNCCGRFGKGKKMWKARLNFHKQCLEESKKFDNWIEGWEETQRENKIKDIKYHTKKIKQIKIKLKEN
jgi:hypothetical protein